MDQQCQFAEFAVRIRPPPRGRGAGSGRGVNSPTEIITYYLVSDKAACTFLVGPGIFVAILTHERGTVVGT